MSQGSGRTLDKSMIKLFYYYTNYKIIVKIKKIFIPTLSRAIVWKRKTQNGRLLSEQQATERRTRFCRLFCSLFASANAALGVSARFAVSYSEASKPVLLLTAPFTHRWANPPHKADGGLIAQHRYQQKPINTNSHYSNLIITNFTRPTI